MVRQIIWLVGGSAACAIGLGVGCAPPIALPPEPGSGAPLAGVPAAPAASSSAAASAEPATPPAAAGQPDAQPDAAAWLAELDPAATADLPFLRRLCRTAVGKYTDASIPELREAKPRLGCACCPPFDDCPPDPSGAVEVEHPRSIYAMRHRTPGSFTAPGAPQIAATFYGCEPGAGNRGGTMILRNAGTRLERVGYRTAVNPDACQAFSVRSGRDLLLCEWGDGQMSSRTMRIIAYDLTDDSFKSDHSIAELIFEHVCMLRPKMNYVRTKLTKLSQRDLNGDGQNDVVLNVEHVSGTVTPKLLADCSSSPDDFPEPKSLSAPWKTQLHYIFDGRSFVPTPKTRQRLRRMATSTVHHGQP